jgi:type II secretory pathway pseudopilin PulG
MRAGRMERRGESETRIGMVLGIVSVVLSAIGIVIAVMILAGAIAFGTAMVHEFKPAIEREHAQAELAAIAATIDEYLAATGKLPTTLQDLTRKSDGVSRPLNRSDLRDPWSREYEYVAEGTARYRLFSTGPDGQADTADDVQHAQVKTER